MERQLRRIQNKRRATMIRSSLYKRSLIEIFKLRDNKCDWLLHIKILFILFVVVSDILLSPSH